MLQNISKCVAPNWSARLKHEFELPYFNSIRNFLHTEYKSNQVIYPPQDKIFRSLQLVDFDNIKVVILGQDPYHDVGQANGLSFAVSNGTKPPPSLVNIFKEIASDLNAPPPKNTSLEGWATQGVLLLNSVLTVRAHQAFSHRKQGWEQFTERVIAELNNHPMPIVFLLWGTPAQQKAKIITNPKHLILMAPHPSPLSAYRGFLGCKHFSKANEFLKERAIDWLQT